MDTTKDCRTCKYRDVASTLSPCNGCSNNLSAHLPYWQPQNILSGSYKATHKDKIVPASDLMVSRQDNGGPALDDTPKATPKVASDGGSSTYYFLPKGATELNDVIEFKDMSFARGNMFKALYRLGEKEGIDVEYDLNKIELFLGRLREIARKGGRL